MIQARNINKKYNNGQDTILKDVSFEVADKKIIAIYGPSGSGKSTLLNILSTLDTDYTGDVYYGQTQVQSMNEQAITNLRKNEMGFIFQKYELFPMLSAEENIRIAANLRQDDAIDISYLAAKLGIETLLHKYPSELSGGQQQRVAIARALVKNPRYVFCDEPTGALDTKTSFEVMRLIKELNAIFETTFIIVTHDNDVAKMSDIIVKIDSGRIAAIENVRVGASV
jgi:putative ABC transport system ATP-binding protein